MDHPKGCRCDPCQEPYTWGDASLLLLAICSVAAAAGWLIEQVRGVLG